MAFTDRDPAQTDPIPILLVGVPAAAAADIERVLGGWDAATFEIVPIETPAGMNGMPQLGEFRVAIVGVGGNQPADVTRVRQVSAAIPEAVTFAMGPAMADMEALDLIHAGAEDYLGDHGGSVRALPRIITYATKRRRVNAQVQRLAAQRGHVESLLSTTFELSATPMVLSEEDGTVLIVNGAFTETFGWSARDAAGRNLTGDLFRRLAEHAQSESTPQTLPDAKGGTLVATIRRAVTPMDQKNLVVWAFVPVPDPRGAAPQDRLAQLVGDGTKRLAAGRIQLVKVDTVRARFGERWARWSERVYEVAQRTIRKRLSHDDVVSRNQQGDFVVCFAALDGESAWFKAQAIQREIERQVLGEDADEPIGRVVAEAHEIDVTAEDAKPGVDIADMIGAKLNDEAERLRADEQAILADLYSGSRLDMRRVETADGEAAPVLVAEFDPRTRSVFGRLAQVTADPAHLAADVDMMLLGRVSGAMPNLLGRRPELLVVASLHASTLQARHLRERLFGVCRQMPDGYRRALILRIEGMPADILPARAVELLAPLRALSRFRILALQRPDPTGLPLRDCGVSLIEVDCGLLTETASRDPARVERLQADLRRQRTHLVVARVPDRAGAEAAVGLGARFLSFETSQPVTP